MNGAALPLLALAGMAFFCKKKGSRWKLDRTERRNLKELFKIGNDYRNPDHRMTLNQGIELLNVYQESGLVDNQDIRSILQPIIKGGGIFRDPVSALKGQLNPTNHRILKEAIERKTKKHTDRSFNS